MEPTSMKELMVSTLASVHVGPLEFPAIDQLSDSNKCLAILQDLFFEPASSQLVCEFSGHPNKHWLVQRLPTIVRNIITQQSNLNKPIPLEASTNQFHNKVTVKLATPIAEGEYTFSTEHYLVLTKREMIEKMQIQSKPFDCYPAHVLAHFSFEGYTSGALDAIRQAMSLTPGAFSQFFVRHALKVPFAEFISACTMSSCPRVRTLFFSTHIDYGVELRLQNKFYAYRLCD